MVIPKRRCNGIHTATLKRQDAGVFSMHPVLVSLKDREHKVH